MGHIRLGRLPRTRKWSEVVGLVGGGGGTVDVANATLDASLEDLSIAANDPGLVYSFWLLTRIPEAARSDNFADELRSLGLQVSDAPSLPELVAALTDAVDRHVDAANARSDLGEMAQMAAVEALHRVTEERSRSLFGTTPADVQRELGGLATQAQFGSLARDFFSRFTERVLTYYLSRELPAHVGRGLRFDNQDQRRQFREDLVGHCWQASRIVETFAGGWFSKARFEGDLSRERTNAFIGYALKKMRSELRQGAGE